MSQVYLIQKDEVERAAETLVKAFKKDEFMQWTFMSPENYEKNSKRAMALWVNYCRLYGMAIRTKSFESVALRKRPGDSGTNIWRLIRSGLFKTPNMMGKEAFGRLMQFDKLSTKARKAHFGKGKYWYCWMLGTLPKKQGQGLGKLLMQHTFDQAKKDGVPCCLETASTQSRAVHESKGYKTFESFPLGDGSIDMVVMEREVE